MNKPTTENEVQYEPVGEANNPDAPVNEDGEGQEKSCSIMGCFRCALNFLKRLFK